MSYQNGLGYSLSDYANLFRNLFDPWTYQPSTPQPGAPVATSREEVYRTLNTLTSVLRAGLEGARGNPGLTSQGEALSGELAQFYARAGRDYEWARTNVSGFAYRVYQWSRAVGESRAGGARAFEEAQRGASPFPGGGGGLPPSPDLLKWALPVGAGIVLLLLLRR